MTSSFFGPATLLFAVSILAASDTGPTPKKGDPPGTPLPLTAWGDGNLEAYLQNQPLSEESDLQTRLNDIGRRLVEVSDQPHATRRFLLVGGDHMQALAFPDGSVCATEGLLRGLDDDELAFAVAHELSHIDLRHSLVAWRVERLLPGKPKASSAPPPAVLRLMQSHEREADRFGALYAVRAGFRFSASLTALDRLADSAPRQKDAFHPRFGERRAELEEFRAELEAAIEAFDRGLEALVDGYHEEAVFFLRLFVSEYPNCVPGRVNLGVAFLALGRKGVQTPGQLFESLPIVPEQKVIVLRGGDGGRRTDFLHARDEFGMALKLEPGNPNALVGWALVHLRMDDFEEARRASAEALARAPEDAVVLMCAANVAFLAGEFADAERLYRRVLELQPGWPPPEANLERVAAERPDSEQASD